MTPQFDGQGLDTRSAAWN